MRSIMFFFKVAGLLWIAYVGMASFNTWFTAARTLAVQEIDARATIEAQVTNNYVVINRQNSTDEFLQFAFEYSDTVVIRFGSGGHLDGMIDTLNYLDTHPTKKVIIDGPCFSACTLLLTRPNNVTFTRNANFFFHAAARGKEISVDGTEEFVAQFDEDIQNWIYEMDAVSSLKFTPMPFVEAVMYTPDYMVVSEESIPTPTSFKNVSYNKKDLRKY